MFLKRKVNMGLAFLLTAGMLAAGCGSTENAANPPAPTSAPATELSPEIAKIYEQAKKEGKVIFWSPDDQEVAKLKEDFSKKFPGVTLEHFQLQPPNVLEKIITESSANQTNVDVFDLYYNDVPQLIDRDLVKAFEWSQTFGLDPSVVLYDQKVLSGWQLSYPIIYNTNLVKKEDVPKTWEELLDPKWKGKLLVEARGQAFPILSFQWGEEKTINYVKDLMKQDPVIIKGGTPSIQALASGQAVIGVGASYIYKVDDMKKKGAPLEWAKVGPIPLQTHTFGVLKNAPHPNAALLLAYFLVSKEGLQSREDASGGTILKGEAANGQAAKIIAENKLEMISEMPEKAELRKKMETEVQNILSSLK